MSKTNQPKKFTIWDSDGKRIESREVNSGDEAAFAAELKEKNLVARLQPLPHTGGYDYSKATWKDNALNWSGYEGVLLPYEPTWDYDPEVHDDPYHQYKNIKSTILATQPGETARFTYEDPESTPSGPVDRNSDEFINSSPNEVLTYGNAPEWFNNRAIYHENTNYSNQIREKIYAGTHGFNPATGALVKLDTPVTVPTETTDFLGLEPKNMEEEAILENKKNLEKKKNELLANKVTLPENPTNDDINNAYNGYLTSKTNEILADKSTWPLSSYDAEKFILPDGRSLVETQEYEDWTVKELGGYELDDGSTGTWEEYKEDYSWWDFRRNMKNEIIYSARHDQLMWGGIGYKDPTYNFIGIFDNMAAPPNHAQVVNIEAFT